MAHSRPRGSCSCWSRRSRRSGAGSRPARAGNVREAALRGAGAGLVFAAAVVAGEALSAALDHAGGERHLVWFGADLLRTGVVAGAWGVGGGVLAVLAGRAATGPVEAGPPPAPPSPTSL